MRPAKVLSHFAMGLALMVAALAQDITKGTIAGVVRDASGAVMPSVTVRLTSPFGERSTKTNSLGEYSFPNLVVGSGYQLIIEQPGFATAKIANLSVGVNRQTTQDVNLQVGQTTQTIEVSEASVTIDTSSTTIGADLGENLYKNVPVGRNISAVISLAPGVADSGGAGAANPSVNGASGLENQYIINGANVTDPAYGGFGSYSRVFGALGNGVNFDFIQEVQVQTGGFEAQYGQALGGVVNVLTKSGGNTYHGSFYGYFSPKAFAVDRVNTNPDLVNKVTYTQNIGSYDFGGDLGGYLLKDKLFWYGGFNPRFDYTYIKAEPGFGNAQLGTVGQKTTTYNYVGKLNWNLGAQHQFEGSIFGDPSSIPTTWLRGINTNPSSTTIDRLSTSSLDYGSRTWTGRYNGAISTHWIVSANFSDYNNHVTETPAFNGYRISDITPGQEGTGSNFSSGGLGFRENSEATVHQFTVMSSHMFTLWGGHTLEYGYQFEDQNYDDFRLNTGPDFQIPDLPEFSGAAGQTQHGAALTRTHQVSADPNSPIVLRVTRGDYSSPAVTTLSRYHSGFIQDNWKFGRHLTVKPGIRIEQQAMAGNALRYVFAHNWAPRIGMIFDPSGDGKSKFYANWGRFFEKIPSDISIRAFSFETSTIGALYKDPGPNNQPDLSPANYISGGRISLQGSPEDLTIVAGGTRAEYQDEVVGGYEKEIGNSFVVGGRFVYRHMRRIIEDVSGVNVTQALAGVPQQYVVANPSAIQDIFFNAVPCSSGPDCDLDSGFTAFPGGSPLGADGIPDGFPNPSRIYKAMQLTASRRFTHNLQLYANYTLSKLYGNFQGSFRGDNGQTDPNISSLFDFTNSDGLLSGQVQPGVLPTDRTHQLKVFGNYQVRAVNIGVGWNIFSGTPITGLLDHPVYENSGEIPDGPRGAYGRTGWEFPLNVHADYTWNLSERSRVKFVADIFNLGNEKAVFQVFQSKEIDGNPGEPSPDFLKARTYQTPFNARLAVRFEF